MRKRRTPWALAPFAGLHSRPALADTVAPDEPTASADGESSGSPVEALSDRTGYAQVFANPDGTFTYNASPVIQRFEQRDGTWANIDTTLQPPACASSPSSCNFYDAVALDGVHSSAFAMQYSAGRHPGPERLQRRLLERRCALACRIEGVE